MSESTAREDASPEQASRRQLHAQPEARHSALKPGSPTPPVVLMLFSALLVVSAAFGLWIYSLQSRQAQMESRVAEQVASVLQRMELSGEDQQTSFEEIGLSLKALDDRIGELTRLSVEVQQKQLGRHSVGIDELRAEMTALRQKTQRTSAELAALGGLISTSSSQVSGLLAKRLKEAGQVTEQILENQQTSAEQLKTLMAASESLTVYRRTTNQALLRLESRMLLLEKRLEQLESGEPNADRSLGGPLR